MPRQVSGVSSQTPELSAGCRGRLSGLLRQGAAQLRLDQARGATGCLAGASRFARPLTDHYRRQATRTIGAETYANEAELLEPETEDLDQPACSCVFAAIQKLDPDQAELLSRLDLQDEPRASIAADLWGEPERFGRPVYRSRAALKKRIGEICPVCGEGQFMQWDCTPTSVKGSPF